MKKPEVPSVPLYSIPRSTVAAYTPRFIIYPYPSIHSSGSCHTRPRYLSPVGRRTRREITGGAYLSPNLSWLPFPSGWNGLVSKSHWKGHPIPYPTYGFHSEPTEGRYWNAPARDTRQVSSVRAPRGYQSFDCLIPPSPTRFVTWNIVPDIHPSTPSACRLQNNPFSHWHRIALLAPDTTTTYFIVSVSTLLIEPGDLDATGNLAYATCTYLPTYLHTYTGRGTEVVRCHHRTQPPFKQPRWSSCGRP